jgi:two-component system sensor histidine kinase DctS
VLVRLQEREGKAEITVRDNGPGISENSWHWITQPGYTTKNGGNRGMGLFVASRLIEFNGGEISVESDGSSYTEVIIRLPIAELKESPS